MQTCEIFMAILQAPAGKAAEELGIVLGFVAEFAIFGKLLVVGGFLLGVVECVPLAGDLHAAELPIGFWQVRRGADGAGEKLGAAVVFAGDFGPQSSRHLLPGGGGFRVLRIFVSG